MSTRTVFHRVTGPTRLREAAFSVASAWTASATNYYTATLRLRRAERDPFPAQTVGELVGTALSLATHSLAADEWVTLYTFEAGLAMADGDLLVLSLVETGSPAVLDAPYLWLHLQRIAR